MQPAILNGVRVLDFTVAAVGPLCSRIMADMGAEVVRIERPAGADQPARFVPNADGEVRSDILFLHCNGGKKSIGVDLKQPRGRELVAEMVKQADVIVENFTPHVLRGYGLDYESVRAINPGIVMVSLTGYGQSGLAGNPEHPCTDPIAQAMGGLNWITGERDGMPYTIGGGIGDTMTGVAGALAVGYALYHRQRTGEGQHIDISMIETALFMDCTVMPYVAVNKGANIFHRNGQQNTYTFPMGVLKAKTGYIALQAPGTGPASAWSRLCAAMGRPDLVDDPRYRTDRDRIERTEEVIGIIEDWLQAFENDETALSALAAKRISSGPVLSQEQILEHPHFRERGAFQTVEYPELGPVQVVAPPYHFSRTPARVQGPAPQLGEHNAEVLKDFLGLSDEQVQALTDDQVLFQSPAARDRASSAGATAAADD